MYSNELPRVSVPEKPLHSLKAPPEMVLTVFGITKFPDRLEQFKQTLQPVKLNYQTLSWIKFLLNKPNKKQKQEKYTNQQKSFLEAIGNERSPENVLKENKTTIEKLKL